MLKMLKSSFRISRRSVRLTGALRRCTDTGVKEEARNELIVRVAVIGLPNCGKSTLVNQLMKQKLFAVSPKVHTTQQRALGAFVEDNRQVVLLDTPGVVKYQYGRRLGLGRNMMTDPYHSCVEADMILVLVDAANKRVREKLDHQIIKILRQNQQLPSILVLNKVDKIKDKSYLLLLTDLLTGREEQCREMTTSDHMIHWEHFNDVFMTSAITGDGVDELRQHLLCQCQPGDWMLDGNQNTDTPTKTLVEDIIREKFCIHLNQELPYVIRQIKSSDDYNDFKLISDKENVLWEEYADGSLSIYQNVMCEKNSQKAIVIGRGGKVIKAIASEAVSDLERALGRTVKLFLYVKDH